jgi:excinuclease ABC subunit A
MATDWIVIGGARQHNLKNISLKVPRNKLVVMTGLSGSGKSSLAFDTLYAEGQRKYVESLSTYARQFLEQMQKPEVDFIDGLSPAIAIEQRTASSNPRSTIATTTEIYDYLRLLYASVGHLHCPKCGKAVSRQTVQQIVDAVLAAPGGTRLMVLAMMVEGEKGEFRDVLDKMKRQGFARARIDGELVELALDPHKGAAEQAAPMKLDKTRKHTIEAVIDRLVIPSAQFGGPDKIRVRLTDSIETALKWGENVVRVLTAPPRQMPVVTPMPGVSVQAEKWNETLYSTLNACVECGISFGDLTPAHFSFNSPHGACPECHGLGTKLVFDPELIVADPEKTLENGAVAPWRRGGRRMIIYYKMLLRSVAKHYNVPLETKWKDLAEEFRKTLLHGSKDEIEFGFFRGGAWKVVKRPFEGIIPNLERLYAETESEFTKQRLSSYMGRIRCPNCRGARLRPESRAVTVGDKSIIQICKLSIGKAAQFFEKIELSPIEAKIGEEVIKEVKNRLKFLRDVGLDYLTLDRESATLSGGEAQRIRLATQIGAGLVGCLYILDEPSIGLHQRDNDRLIASLEGLRNIGNTVIVVEHDEDTIRKADWIVDLGPGAGVRGGHIVANGPATEVLASTTSLTSRFLRGELKIELPRKRRAPHGTWLEVQGARENNLKSINAKLPLGCFVCVTGVSGSGKSTLVDEILRKALFRKFYGSKEKPGEHDGILGVDELDKVVVIDQSPIGRTPRSNPATYTGMFNSIRDLFAHLPTARVRGYGAGRFSFNVKGGRCEVCKGDGLIRIEMHFLPDVYVTCETCRGQRYNRDTLEITYHGKNIADVLEMTVDEALTFFRAVPQIEEKLRVLAEVGLGYIKLGQQATTLSGGEAQRVKLAAELARHATGRTLYILDEPTTGLHFADIEKLLEVLNKLTDAGNTVLVIEHNLDVIKCADWLVDLGPEGGDGGGRIVAEGPPEKVAANAKSYTGQFLKRMLNGANGKTPALSPNGKVNHNGSAARQEPMAAKVQ